MTNFTGRWREHLFKNRDSGGEESSQWKKKMFFCPQTGTWQKTCPQKGLWFTCWRKRHLWECRTSPALQCSAITLLWVERTISIWQQWWWQTQATEVRAHLLPNSQQRSQAPMTATWIWFLPTEQGDYGNMNHTEEYLYSLGTSYYH